MANPSDSSKTGQDGAPRRGFLKRVSAVVIGAILFLVPGVTSLIAALDPLRKWWQRETDTDFMPIAPLDAVPADGVPRRFQVLADREDAWNKYVNQPVGSVYLARSPEKPDEVVAFNALCPHLGCFVSYQASRDGFFCPCHRSEFETDGEVVKPSPSERPLDRLETEIRAAVGEETDARQVWIKFQNFRAGGKEKIPK